MPVEYSEVTAITARVDQSIAGEDAADQRKRIGSKSARSAALQSSQLMLV